MNVRTESLLAVARRTDPAIARVLCASVREHQAMELECELSALAAESGGRLVVALDRVDQFTSAGINALIAVHKRCTEHGGQLVLCGVGPELGRLLRVTRLDQLLTITPREAQAVAAFQKRSATRPGASHKRWRSNRKRAA